MAQHKTARRNYKKESIKAARTGGHPYRAGLSRADPAFRDHLVMSAQPPMAASRRYAGRGLHSTGRNRPPVLGYIGVGLYSKSQRNAPPGTGGRCRIQQPALP